MDFSSLLDRYSEAGVLAGGGLAIGMLFGFFAQRSRFCLRAAVIDFARGVAGEKLAVWLLTFGAALLGVQALVAFEAASLSEARQIASPQSLSGAAIGGAMFGAGMVMARGCASRLLVLSATGNLRALLSGLVFAVVAQASLHGVFAPLRDRIAGAWVTSAGGNDLTALLGLSSGATIGFALLWLAAGAHYARRARLSPARAALALGVGSAVPLAWWFTASVSSQAFEPTQVEGISFTGPSADVLMMALATAERSIDFDIGLVPGVFLGSFLAAGLWREVRLQGFEGGASMRRYLLGAALMGFGGMLSGGCAVGAGVTGASVFALTAWVTLGAIWLSAALVDRWLDSDAVAGHGGGASAAPASAAPSRA